MIPVVLKKFNEFLVKIRSEILERARDVVVWGKIKAICGVLVGFFIAWDTGMARYPQVYYFRM